MAAPEYREDHLLQRVKQARKASNSDECTMQRIGGGKACEFVVQPTPNMRGLGGSAA